MFKFDLYDFFQIMIYVLWVRVLLTYTHRDDSGTTMSVNFQ